VVDKGLRNEAFIAYDGDCVGLLRRSQFVFMMPLSTIPGVNRVFKT